MYREIRIIRPLSSWMQLHLFEIICALGYLRKNYQLPMDEKGYRALESYGRV